MGQHRSRLLTIGIGAVILGSLVGIGHVLWTRSADSEIVHYSWPVKWALTLAAESPDLPIGSRFTTVTVRNASDGDHWTVAGEVELPSIEGQRLVTSYVATVSSQCPNVSERRCWAIDELILGSVPAAIPAPLGDRSAADSDPPLEFAAVAPAVVEPAPVSELVTPPEPSEAEQDEDMEFILTESLVEPVDELFLTLGGPSRIHQPHAAEPRYDPVLVRDIQRGLAALGHDPGPIDGLLGRQTRAAVESFREREGLASAAIGFDLLNEITRRLSRNEPAPARISPPAELQQPRETQRQPWACASVNSKNRDCGA